MLIKSCWASRKMYIQTQKCSEPGSSFFLHQYLILDQLTLQLLVFTTVEAWHCLKFTGGLVLALDSCVVPFDTSSAQNINQMASIKLLKQELRTQQDSGLISNGSVRIGLIFVLQISVPL